MYTNATPMRPMATFKIIDSNLRNVRICLAFFGVDMLDEIPNRRIIAIHNIDMKCCFTRFGTCL